jgi:mono/diheme cytochrome c family protein
LRPINFTDPGTIATVVENFAFWRIKEGGPGLPNVSTPWDSAMPAWKDVLTDTQIWKIIMGEYVTAGVMARQREEIEH